MKIAINGNNGSNGECYGWYGEDNGQCKKQNEYLTVSKHYEDLFH
jgi:hypothetical protein